MTLSFMVAQRRTAAVAQRASFEKVYVHEAAHAVVGSHFGLTIAGLRAGMPTAGTQPFGWCRFSAMPLAALRLADEMVMALAGGVADEKLTGRDTTSDSDLQIMMDPVLRHCGGDQTQALEMLTVARKRAADLVSRFWPQIVRLADALAVAGSMTEAEIAPFLSDIPRAARTAPSLPAPVRSSPAEIAPTRTRAASTPRTFEICRTRDDAVIGRTIELAPGGRVAAWRGEELVGIFPDRVAAARAV